MWRLVAALMLVELSSPRFPVTFFYPEAFSKFFLKCFSKFNSLMVSNCILGQIFCSPETIFLLLDNK